jgi:threonine/homoserine efflux transporter RhtA
VNRTAVGITMAAVGGIIFGTSATVVGTIIDDVDPLRLSALRIAVAGVCLLPWAIVYRSAIRRAPVRVAMVGLLQIVLNASFYLSLRRIGVGPAIGLEFLAPVLIVVWDRVIGHARPRAATWFGVFTSVVGVGLLVQIGNFATVDIIGVIAGIGAAVFLAIYLRLSQDVGAIVGGFPLAAGAIAIGGAAGLVVARPWSMTVPSDPAVVWTIVILGTFMMALPLSLEIASLSRAPARVVGVVITIEPVAAALTAWIALDETLEPLQIVGLFLIVGAVAAVSLIAASSRQPRVSVA